MDHHQALNLVASDGIRFHTEAHPQPGFALPEQRGQLTADEKHELEACWRTGLIEPLPATSIADRVNRERHVALTNRGAQELDQEWGAAA